jgi:hypothetical protein
MEKILDMVNQNTQDALKKFQDTKNKENETQKQRNSREDFNRHQSKTKDTINKEINEIKMTIQNINEVLNKDMENLRKKHQTESC